MQRQDGEAFQQSLYELSLFNEQRNDVMKKFLNEPIQSTLLGFSRVTNIFRDVLKPHEHTASANSSAAHGFNNNPNSSPNGKHNNNGGEMSRSALKNNGNKNDKFNYNGDDISNLMDSMSADNIHSSNNDGFEVVMKVDLGPMPSVTRGTFVTRSQFQYDKEGKVVDVDKLKSLIYKGVDFLLLFLL